MAPRSHDIPVKTLILAVWAGIVVGAPALDAFGQPDVRARRSAIIARLKPIRPSAKRITIAPGDTAFVRQTVTVPTIRIRGGELDYEGMVTGIVSPAGVVVHRRVHDVERRTTPDGQLELGFVYAIHVEPGTVSGGQVRLTLSLVERLGLANTIVKKSIVHELRIGKADPAPREVAADFYGYRMYRRVAERRRRALLKTGLRLSLQDQDRLPPLDRVPEKVAAQVLRFDRERRLFWVAQRHLVAARQHPNPDVRALADAYLDNLDRPRKQWQGVPAVSVLPKTPIAETAPPANTGEPPTGPVGQSRSGTSVGQSRSGTSVTRLQPSSERPDDTGRPRTAVPPPGSTSPTRLRPSAEYEVNTEREPPPAPPPPPRPPVAEAAPGPELRMPRPSEDEDPDKVVYDDDPFADEPLRRFTRLPSYYRGLVLEDPNIAHGGGIRASIGTIQTRESANTVAIFYFAQAALTRYLGAEFTIPTQYLDITSFPSERNPPAQYEVGNPLIALKYRLQLPKVLDRHPALVLKARWGIPVAPLHSVPAATGFVVEDFTREVNFVDTYAFFLENHDFGVGANLVWRWKWLYTALQVYTDVFVPISDSAQSGAFTAISYGASVGALPFGDIVGLFAEGRGTSLLLGGGRSEFFTYLGARARFLDWIEPAAWVALPVGSVREASPIQFGIELRFSYDVDDILEPPRRKRQQDILE